MWRDYGTGYIVQFSNRTSYLPTDKHLTIVLSRPSHAIVGHFRVVCCTLERSLCAQQQIRSFATLDRLVWPTNVSRGELNHFEFATTTQTTILVARHCFVGVELSCCSRVGRSKDKRFNIDRLVFLCQLVRPRQNDFTWSVWSAGCLVPVIPLPHLDSATFDKLSTSTEWGELMETLVHQLGHRHGRNGWPRLGVL